MKVQKTAHQFPSIAAMSGATGVPVSLIRQWKKSGCPGFSTNGKVDTLQVINWLATKGRKFKPSVSLESARATLAMARAKQIERDAAQVDGSLAPVEEQARAVELIVHYFMASIPNVATSCAVEINKTDFIPTFRGIEKSFQNLLLNAATGVAAWYPLPEWATEAIRRGVQGKHVAVNAADFAKRVDAWKEIIGQMASEHFRAALAEVNEKQGQ